MIQNAFSIFKVYQSKFLMINQLRFKKDQQKRKQAFFLIFSYIFLLGMFSFYTAGYVYALHYLQLSTLTFSYLLVLASSFCFLFTIYQANSLLFLSRDHEQLLSFPCTISSIILGKLLFIYVNQLIFTLVITLPGAILYLILTPSSLVSFLYYLIALAFIPLIPIVFAAALGALLTIVTSRFKHKTLLKVILSFAFMAAIFAGSFSSANLNEAKIIELSVSLESKIHSAYPLATLFSNGIQNKQVSSLLLFCGLSLASITLFTLLLSKIYLSLGSVLSAKETSRKYQYSNQKKSILKALVGKELRRYFSSSLYIMNTSVGYLMTLAFAISVPILGVEKLEKLMEMQGLSKVIVLAAPIIIASMNAMMPSSAAALSLEGKSFWIVQTLPISSKQLFHSKILAHLSIAVPFTLLSSAILAFSLEMLPLQRLATFIMPLCYVILSSYIGLTLNIKFVNFKWENEVEIIKQSTPILLMLVVCILIVAPVIILCINFPAMATLIQLIASFISLMICAILEQKNNQLSLSKIA